MLSCNHQLQNKITTYKIGFHISSYDWFELDLPTHVSAFRYFPYWRNNTSGAEYEYPTSVMMNIEVH